MYCILIKNQKKHVFYKYLSLEAIEKGPPACYTPYNSSFKAEIAKSPQTRAFRLFLCMLYIGVCWFEGIFFEKGGNRRAAPVSFVSSEASAGSVPVFYIYYLIRFRKHPDIF